MKAMKPPRKRFELWRASATITNTVFKHAFPTPLLAPDLRPSTFAAPDGPAGLQEGRGSVLQTCARTTPLLTGAPPVLPRSQGRATATGKVITDWAMPAAPAAGCRAERGLAPLKERTIQPRPVELMSLLRNPFGGIGSQ